MNAMELAAPVTRGELREELAVVRHESAARFAAIDDKFAAIDDKFAEVDDRFASLDTKSDVWFGALLSRVQQGENRMDRIEQRIEQSERRLLAHIDTTLVERLSAEFARHARTIQEEMRSQVSVIDEKYNDLPGRVEETVFPLEPR
jgi:hypothetical protein